MKLLANWMKQWWEGKYVPPPPPDFSGGVVIMSIGHRERHWSARTASAIGTFVAKEWKWVLGFVLAVIGIALKK